MRMPPVMYCGECIMLMTSFRRDFVEVCVDMKQQGVGGYDSWGARPEPFHQIPANRDYQWGFTLVPVRSANQANEAAKYDYR